MQGPILITSRTGQLSSALARAGRGMPFERRGRPSFDFDHPDTLDATFAAVRPAAVVNTAAYTAVDAAETDAVAAFRANRDGPRRIAALCASSGALLIHISTDYVFDGTKGRPYVESDATAPLGVYGASKLAGEQAVLAAGARVIVLRTAWLISATGRNFIRTILAARQKTDHLRVVADQWGSPTSADDLAAAIIAILCHIESVGWQESFGGVFHAAGSGPATWHDLATATFEMASRYGVTPPSITPIQTAQWPTPAQRPADSRLDCQHLAKVFGVCLPPWRESLGAIIDECLGGIAR